MKKLALILTLIFASVANSAATWSTFDATKPADNRRWDKADDEIRDNWEALEARFKLFAYDVNDYDAEGDGSTDDTTAIQAAITAAKAAGGGVVFFPIGTYLVTSTIDFSKCFLVGAGWDAPNELGSRIIFDVATDTCLYAEGFRSGVENLTIQKDAAFGWTEAIQTASTAIQIRAASGSYVRNCNISSQATCILFEGSSGEYFYEVSGNEFRNYTYGVYLTYYADDGTTTDDVPPNGSRIFNNNFRGDSPAGGTAITLIGNESHTIQYIQVHDNSIENHATVWDLTLTSNCEFLRNEVETYTTFFDYALGELVVLGTQDGGDDAALMTDSTATFIADQLIDRTVYNITDGSSGTITDNDGTTITATLSGGTDDDWDDDDIYSITSDAIAARYEAGGGCLPATTRGHLPAAYNAPTDVYHGRLFATGQSSSTERDGYYGWLDYDNQTKTILAYSHDSDGLGQGLDPDYIMYRFTNGHGLMGVDATTEKWRIEKNGNFIGIGYHWKDEFDSDPTSTALNNWSTGYWTVGGTNGTDDDVIIGSGAGGKVTLETDGALSDSVSIEGAKRLFAANNPKMEVKFQLAAITTVYMAIGFTEDGFVDVNSPDNDYICLTYDSHNDTNWRLRSDDANAGDVSGDTGVAASAGITTVRFDLTDTEQPRVWINGTEVASGLDSNTVTAAGQFRPYIMVQQLSTAGTDSLDVYRIQAWQDE